AAVEQVHAHVITLLQGVGAPEQEVGDHQELGHFQGPDGRVGEGLAEDGIEQHADDGEDQVRGAAPDEAGECIDAAYVNSYRPGHGVPCAEGYGFSLVQLARVQG